MLRSSAVIIVADSLCLHAGCCFPAPRCREPDQVPPISTPDWFLRSEPPLHPDPLPISMPDDSRATVPIRVVLLLDSLTVPHWVAEQILAILRSDFAEIVGLVLNNGAVDGAGSHARRSLFTRAANAWRLRNRVLLERYLRFDARRYPAAGADPFAPSNLTSALAAVPRIVANPRRTAFSDYLDDEALAGLRAMQSDVAVRFGFRILRGGVLGTPRYGVWSYHHGDNSVNRGSPAGLWEVFRGWPSTGAVLQKLSEDLDGGIALARTRVATNPISVHQNRIALYFAAAPLLVQKLRDLSRLGASAVEAMPNEPPFAPYSNRLFVAPTLRELTKGVVSLLVRLISRKMRVSRAKEQWQLAYGFDRRVSSSNSVPQTAMFRLKALVPPADRFWADPCVVQMDDRSFVFFEELEFAENKGRICVVEMGAAGRIGDPCTVINAPHHLSYPFVFRYQDEWYMYVESSACGAQEVYRATSFPHGWVLDRALALGQPVVDPTIAQLNGRWWLFAGTQPALESTYDDLSLFYSDSPLGPWTPHPANPVISDASRARPAGRLFESGNAVIRPGQNCTPTYGSGIVFNRIVRIDTDAYVEETVSRIEPAWSPGLKGIHTISAAGPLTVVDARVTLSR